jgi:hypothetical protein
VRAGTRAWSVWLALIVAAAGCEKILGIHDSHPRDGGADGPGAAGSAGAPPSDGSAGAGGALAGNGGAGAGGATGGRGGVGAAGAAPDAGPTGDAMADTSEVGDASPPPDAATEAPPPKCPSSDIQTVTMFESDSGPHGTDKNVGACGFPLPVLDPNHDYADAPDSLLGKGTACGACLLVSYQGNSVEVQIIDSSGTAAINIDPEAYLKIDPTGSNPMVNVRFVPCNYGGTIRAQFRGQDDPAVLLYGFSTRPMTVEVMGPGTNAPWTMLRQMTSSYWEPPGGYSPGGISARLRLTDELGAVVTTDALAIDGAFHDTGKQFPICAP